MRNDDQFGGAPGGAAGDPAGGAARSPFESGMQGGGGATERARETLEEAKETAREKTHEAGERARDFRMNMADKLETGAQRLRQRASGIGSAGSIGEAQDDGPLHRALDSDAAHKVEHSLADGLESTADWIRTADLDSIRGGIENQVRTHPGRTLLVALGVGYLIGRAFGGGEKGGTEIGRGRENLGEIEPNTGFGSARSHGLH